MCIRDSIDADEVIFFDENGNFEPDSTNKELSERLEHVEKAVIPGFYGSRPDGTIKTFSRAQNFQMQREL